METEAGRDWKRLIWGAALVLLGALFLAEHFDLLPAWAVSLRWWPLIVIGFGFAKLVQPRRASDIGSFVTLTLLGMWFMLVANDYFGFSWHNSWPLALIAAGAGMVARALAARWLPDQG